MSTKNHIVHDWIMQQLEDGVRQKKILRVQFMVTKFKMKQAVLKLIKGFGPFLQKNLQGHLLFRTVVQFL